MVSEVVGDKMNDYRALFPYFGNNPFTTYLDSANTSQILGETLEALNAFYLFHNYNAGRAGYAGARFVDELKAQATKKAAEFIGATEEQVVFTTGATESLNMIAYSLCDWLETYDLYYTLITTELEHASALLPWMMSPRITIEYAKLNNDYTLDMEALRTQVKNNPLPCIVLVASMTNTTGEIRPLKEIGELCAETGSIFVVDHAQGAAHFPVNVEDCHIDFMGFSLHKMYGPKGVGVLFAKHLPIIETFKYGGGMNESYNKAGKIIPSKDRLYAGTIDMPGIYASIHSFDFLMDNWAKVQKIEKYLSIYAFKLLSRIDGINILSKPESPILLFKIENIEALDIMYELSERDICIRAGNHCSKLTPFGLSTCRVSLGAYNTPQEIENLYHALLGVTRCESEQKKL